MTRMLTRLVATMAVALLLAVGMATAASAGPPSDAAYLAVPLNIMVNNRLWVVGDPTDVAWRDLMAACPGTSKHAAQLAVKAAASDNLLVHVRCANGKRAAVLRTLRGIPVG